MPKGKNRIKQNPEQIGFQSLSIDDQLRAVLSKGKNLIFAKGFRLEAANEREIRFLGRNQRNQIVFERFRKSIYENVKLIAKNSFTKSEFNSTGFGYRYFSEEKASKLKAMRSIILYASLQPVRQSSIRTVLSSYTPMGNGIYQKTDVTASNLIEGRRRSSKIIAILDGYKSVSEFSQLLKHKLSLLNSNSNSSA